MRRLFQRLAAGLVAPLLLVGGMASTGTICPARLGLTTVEPCPCEHAAPAEGEDFLVQPCCCDEVSQAPASSVPVPVDSERVGGPTPPILIVGEGLSFALVEAAPRPAPVDRPSGAGPPVLRKTSILLI